MSIQALLKAEIPNLIYIHCRAHALQLTIVNASNTTPAILRSINCCNKLYSFFSSSPKRIRELQQMEVLFGEYPHKLVQPGSTRWLSYDNSIRVILDHYGSLLLTIENIYNEGGINSTDAGGLLLQLRSSSCLYYICFLSDVLQVLSRLSKVFQSSNISLPSSLEHVVAVKDFLESYDFNMLTAKYNSILAKIQENGAHIQNDDSNDQNGCEKQVKKFLIKLLQNLNDRFGQSFNATVSLLNIFETKEESPNFDEISEFFNLPIDCLNLEWQVLRRNPRNFGLLENQIKLSTDDEFKKMFPILSSLMFKILVLPVGTASVERSFSTLNRIMTDQRNRLTYEHLSALMKISIEGPPIPDIMDDSTSDFDAFVSIAFDHWSLTSHRLSLY